MDQNEKLGFGGVKILQVIDAKWRCPIHWTVGTSLRGLEHSRVFQGAVRKWGRVPDRVVVDKAAAWSGVERMMHLREFEWNIFFSKKPWTMRRARRDASAGTTGTTTWW